MSSDKCTFCRGGAEKRGGIYKTSEGSRFWYHSGHEPNVIIPNIILLFSLIMSLTSLFLYFFY